VHAVCARRRTDRRGPKTPGAGPARDGEEIEQRVPAAAIAAELRVSERSVRRWRQAWRLAGPAGVASRGQAARCRLDEQQLAALDVALDAGPLAAGFPT